MSEIIYSSSPVADKGGRQAVNPLFFTVPEPDVKKVYINGDYPKIKTAYEEVGAKVLPLSDLPESKKAQTAADDGKKGA